MPTTLTAQPPIVCNASNRVSLLKGRNQCATNKESLTCLGYNTRRIKSVDAGCSCEQVPLAQRHHRKEVLVSEVRTTVSDFESLYKAMNRCKKNVMWKDSVAGYVKNGLANCYRLNKQLLDGTYKIDKYTKFTVHEPKKREISSTRFKDRVFQRSLCDNYLYGAITKSFIYDNGACQVGKGTDFSRRRLVRHMQKYYRKHGLNGYVLNCDIKDYFGSTRHDVAKEILRRSVEDDWAYEHVVRIIDSFDQKENPGVGMGLGSQVTQLIQLSILNEMDHIIKEKLDIKYYIRYMDDFILIHDDIEHLKTCEEKIREHLFELGLKLNKRKTQISRLKQGIKFLGFTFCLTETGKVIKKIDRKNVTRQRRKLKRLKKLVDKGVLTKEQVDEIYKVWKAHAKKGNSYNLLKRMDGFYNELWRQSNV